MNLDTQERMASNIKYLRGLFGYTQEDVAQLIHLSRCTYAQFESGIRIPSADIIFTLSQIYNVSVDTILQADPGQFISRVIISDKYRGSLSSILDTFLSLNQENRNILLKKARAMAAEEKTFTLSDRE